ncbi:hypothetical protein DENSPDRAFT_871419 [Dentipellis sp. KUC8613]|nr:hypothetical protein DENSPDRAFT_871419 [Dentipellis sp. KUC8613]
MPNVVVHPPEEEMDEIEPCTVFNAAEAEAEPMAVFTTPEMGVLEARLDVWQQVVHPTVEHAPVFSRSSTQESDIIMPRRGSFHHGRPPSPLGIFTEDGSSSKRMKEDEDVIEVVKVRRADGMRDVRETQESAPNLKKNKTFKARATQAFRSIRNVGKASRKVAVQDVFDAKAPGSAECSGAGNTVPRPNTPNLTRRKSRPLSQMFTLSQAKPTFAEEHDSPQTNSTMSSFASIRRTSSFSDTPSHDTLRPPVDEMGRPSSPSLSTKSKTTRRFSFLNLHNIFSDPTSPLPPINTALGRTSDSLPSSVEPETPVDDVDPRHFTPPTVQSLDINMGERLSESQESQTSSRKESTSLDHATNFARPRDFEFEMRLDSLHFDSLSFDPDTFDVDVDL